MSKIAGKFQIRIILKEFVDTGEHIEVQPIADYTESCWEWGDTKKSVNFFMERIEERLNGEE